ncbi:DUF3068 domain-containing protein [Actinomadura scrupuli]|uniref:DUF3068 domain-containing protein n=1 Tax=Actinomadura scrupuli TaxID=559629 RepID=UPI003D96D33F
MRRRAGLILVALGAFFLSLAPMVKFYVAQQVLAAPTDFWQKTTLRAEGASYLDMTGPKVRKNVTLVLTNTTRGDPKASDDKTAVWDSFTSMIDPGSGSDVTVQGRRFAFDRRSGQLVNCCGAAVDQDTTVKQTGLGLLWPIGNVQKRTYSYFDQNTRRAWPMTFDGEERIGGISTYRFVQTIPETKVSAIPGIPADLLGLDKKKGNLPADLMFQATITMWVDPRTGVPVSQEENIRSTARTKDGAGQLTLSTADLKTVPESQQALVKLSNGYAWKFVAVQEWLPVGSLVFGLFMLASGALLPLFESGGGRDKRPSPNRKGGPARGVRSAPRSEAERRLPARDRYSTRS